MSRVLTMTGWLRGRRRAATTRRREAKARPVPARLWLHAGLAVLLLLAIVSGVREVTHWLTSPGTLPIRTVSVVGDLKNVPAQQVRAVVDAHLRGGFFGVNLAAISRALQRVPWIAQANVRRVWPDGLAIRIVQQQAVAVWDGDALLNPHGAVFRPPRDTFPGGLPDLRGPAGKELDLMKRYQTVNALFAKLGLTVTALHEDARRAFTLRLNNGIEVVIGRDWSMPRLARMQAVYRRVLAPKAADIARIDLRYTNGFAVAWKSSAAQAAAVPGGH